MNSPFLDATNNSDINSLFCVEVLMKNIPNSDVRYFDVALLIPSSLFLIFLTVYCRTIYRNHLTINSSIITTFYILLCLACGSKVLRALVAIITPSKESAVQNLNKALWLIVRFFLLSTEMSIITFGVAAAKLDNRTGVKLVLIITSVISLTYTAIQASLEFYKVDAHLFYSLYSHGGALFFFISSLLFFIIYTIIIIMPYTSCSQRCRLPTKPIFYIYCGILAIIYFAEAVGSILFYVNIQNALCVLDVTTFLYFAFYDPLVYATFLYSYFKRRRVLSIGFNQPFDFTDHSVEGLNKYYSSNTVDSSSRGGAASNSNNYSINHSNVKPHPSNVGDINDCQYYPDNYLVVDRPQTNNYYHYSDGDTEGEDTLSYFTQPNMVDLMQEFNILPAGAQFDCTNRYPTSTMGSDMTGVDFEERDRSTIVSLCEEDDIQPMKN